MNNRIDKLPKMYRSAIFERAAVDDENRTVELSFSSETPVERWWGIEILDHKPESVRLARINGGSPLLMDHNPQDQIGVIEGARVENGRGIAKVRFGKSSRAEEIWQDVKDGIRTLVSVGYRIYEAIETKLTDQIIQERATDWEPFEISIVAVPADMAVGIGRGENQSEMNDVKIKREGNPIMDELKVETPNFEKERSDARRAEVDRAREIRALATGHGMVADGETFIADGKSIDDFRAHILGRLKTEKHIDTQQASIGLSDKEVREYSLIRAINAAASGDWSKAGLELELSREMSRKFGRQPKGFYVPDEILAKRALVAASSSLVGTDHIAGSFIEALRAKSVIFQAGAMSLSGLTGDANLPKQSGVGTVEVVAEAGTGTYGDQAFATISLSPYTLRGKTIVSRELAVQSNPSVENLIMQDFVREFALALDYYGLQGTGTAQPRGILNTSGIGSASGTTLGWAGVVELETDVKAANGDIDSMHYVTTPTVNGLLKTRVKETGAGLFISEKDEINGYPVLVTTKMAASRMIFGSFSSLLMAFWGALDLQVDPYSAADNGQIVLRAFQMFDVGVRHAAAFSATTTIT
jgi:HK97 family phage major capsid protein